ncbi:hypothetical protein FGADI_11990 [Fusarium gaditjirri]|uniref:Uncharacterized protein n=1 Tax=Fusarium gaditjirri TaxID=282569 RepID=A0A8H4STD3_9HYPO|nr:hypothetical protein FGADI_11990 [Fusarium gaditjirri]
MGAAGPQDELARRRERGRRSQAAFRKRQAQSNQALEAQNALLKQGIQRLLDAARGDERPEMLSIFRELAVAADIEAPPSISKIDTVSSDNDTITADAKGFQSLLSEILLPATPSQSTQYRLECSMWLDPLHYLRVSLPPQDILPYLGAGAETFAGLLFWSVMEHYQTVCTQHNAKTVIQTGLKHSKATQDIKPSFIETMAKARVEYKQTGSISQAHAVAAEKDLGLVLCNLIETEYRSTGKDPDQWLSCIGIEKRLKKTMSDDLLESLRKAALGDGNAALHYLLENVKCGLYDSCVCFGDGPRWDMETVDQLFAPFTRYLSSHACEDLAIEFNYLRTFMNSFGIQSAVDRVLDRRPPNSIDTNVLQSSITATDYSFIKEVINSSCQALESANRLFEAGTLRYCPVWVFLRIMASIFLLKALSIEIRTTDLETSLGILERSIRALRNSNLDEMHLASRYGELLDMPLERYRQSMVPTTIPQGIRTVDQTSKWIFDNSAPPVDSSLGGLSMPAMDNWLALPFDPSMAPFGFATDDPDMAEPEDRSWDFLWSLPSV